MRDYWIVQRQECRNAVHYPPVHGIAPQERIIHANVSIVAMLTMPTKFSCKLFIWPQGIAREIGNYSLYSRRPHAYLKIRNFITKNGRMDIPWGDCWCHIVLYILSFNPSQRNIKVEVCSFILNTFTQPRSKLYTQQ